MITNDKGYKVAMLICVTGDNNNKYYNMTQTSPTEFLAEWGRVEGHKTPKVYPMSDWDSTYRDKTSEKKKPKPYIDVTELRAESTTSVGAKSNSIFHAKRDKEVKTFIEMIMGYANKSVAANYTVSAEKVTKAMVDKAQAVLNDISDMFIQVESKKTGHGIKIDSVNDKLIELYHIIPRKMKKVQEFILEGSGDLKFGSAFNEARKLFSNEQDALDVMSGQVTMITTSDVASSETKKEHDILHSLGLELSPCSPSEIKMIESKMGTNKGQLIRAYRAHNAKSEETFSKWMKKVDNDKADILWHGSRNENWWSIFQQSLKIRPSNAVLTGAMFGNGVYFADKAQKSIGYTSLDTAYWTRGNASKAILGLYEIHQGKQMVIERHLNEHCSLDEGKMKKKGYHSVFAKGGYDLRNNEYIVYNDNQCTIRYLIEISK